MRYAIISDVHGNIAALEAVIKDSQARQIDKYIFFGDYYMGLPYPNECIDLIRSLHNAIIIKGNNEPFLEELADQDPDTWIDAQFSASYWYSRNIRSDNLEFLSQLPKEIQFYDNNCALFISHSSQDLFGLSLIDEISGLVLAKSEQSTEAFLHYKTKSILCDEPLKRRLSSLTDGIYIFGHTHIQWHLSIGSKVLVNPGACGLPVDHNPKAPCSIVECSPDNVVVEEIRVDYDINNMINSIRKTDLYKQAQVFIEIMIESLSISREVLSFFLQFAEDYATKINDPRRPFMKDTWEEAYKLWRI